MRHKQFAVLVVFFLVLLFFAEAEATNLFFNPLGPDAENSASGFTLSCGPTDYSATFQGQISNFPAGEQGIVGAFIFAAGREICIGLSTVEASKNYKMQIYGDNPATEEVEGAKDGDVIIFKLIVNGKFTPVVLIDDATSPIWKNNQIIFDVNLNIEKAGIEGALNDMLLGGLGAVGAGGGLPGELSMLITDSESGGFGKSIEEDYIPDIPDTPDIPDDPPVIPEPGTLIMFITSLGFILIKGKNIKNNF